MTQKEIVAQVWDEPKDAFWRLSDGKDDPRTEVWNLSRPLGAYCGYELDLIHDQVVAHLEDESWSRRLALDERFGRWP